MRQHPLQLQRAAALCRTSTCMHVGLEGLQNYDIFPAFIVSLVYHHKPRRVVFSATAVSLWLRKLWVQLRAGP